MQPASSSSTTAGTTPPTATEEREAAANNPPRRKRRRMATGHEIVQRAEASRVSPPLSQQQQQPTSPPIGQRHVAEVVAELSGTDSPAPGAHFVEVAAADEPMDMEAGPAAREILLEDIIPNFLPRHQEEIREHLNDEDVQRILNEVRNFLTLLRESGIKLSPGRGRIPTPSLFGRLRRLSVSKDAETIRKFFEKATSFFSAVNTAQTKNTSCLSSMLDSNTHITNFANETEDNLRLLASHSYLKQISSMCDRRGVPDPIHAAAMVEWECWKTNGIFNHELFRTFASMRSGKGLFDDGSEITAILAWPCWRVDGEFSWNYCARFPP